MRAESSSLAGLLDDTMHEFHLATAAVSPPGYHWFDLYVDAQSGEQRAAVTAHGVLSRMVERGDTGRIEDFRILFGKQWLEMGETGARKCRRLRSPTSSLQSDVDR
ncbi:MAG: hypothetical protein ABIR62_09050 [Dokdonella sp.]|uniref:hypothetical protein n=1 Tax=Dokdonella sp. TaxID=2291710 RepID=UPI003267F836